jgi:fucose permease
VGLFFSNQLADRHFAAERFLAVSNVIGGLALIGAAYATSFWPFLICFSIYTLVYVPTIAVGNSLAFANLRDPAKEYRFRANGWNGGLDCGELAVHSFDGRDGLAGTVTFHFLVAAAISFVFAIFSWTSLPHTPPKKNPEGMDKYAWLKAMKMLKSPFILVLFIVTFIDSTIHNGYFVSRRPLS